MEQLIKNISIGLGYDACYILSVDDALDVPDHVTSILLLLKRYDGEEEEIGEYALIHPYYYCSQQAYHMAKVLVEQLKNLGEAAVHLPNLPLKPLLLHIEGFTQRRNSLIYHPEWGSRFHIQAIGLKNKPTSNRSSYKHRSVFEVCAGCTLCMEACPTGAIDIEGVDPSKCMRQHMANGNVMPGGLRHKMGTRLLGCDICQSVCPNNQATQIFDRQRQFTIMDCLVSDKELLNKLSSRIGSNLAIKNRICAQACIAAGNAHRPEYTPILRRLADHPSDTVREHAKWALRMIEHSDII